MGMAASQARYLSLVARRSNCEYEGQQINQARTALSNQSADLFNQMLGLSVPIPPSTQDFTKTQYSFTDGLNDSTIDSWQQLSTPDPNYNYVVTHHYYTDVYTGSEKKLSDPQVQFGAGTAGSTEVSTAAAAVAQAKTNVETAQAALNNIISYMDGQISVDDVNDIPANANSYTLNGTTYTRYSQLTGEAKTKADETIQAFTDAQNENYLNKASLYGNENNLYFDENGNFIRIDDINNARTNLTNGITPQNIAIYNDDELEALRNDLDGAKAELADAEATYNALAHPTYVGNCPLTALAQLTKDQEAEIRQIVNDMIANDINAEIVNCYDPETGTYNGGIYSFEMNGITYYTTLNDLTKSYNSGTGHNQIDGQLKLSYHNATYVPTKIEKTEKALVETDGYGRFTSIRLEDDTVRYELHTEQITDDVAYEDAMNQYYYENAKYDKMVQDINAKTSIIQQQDQQLELRLKQLDTERNALTNEMEAVQAVVKKNVEEGFKAFSG